MSVGQFNSVMVLVRLALIFVVVMAIIQFAMKRSKNAAQASQRRRFESGELRTCPLCAVVIPGAAVVCPNCKRDIPKRHPPASG